MFLRLRFPEQPEPKGHTVHLHTAADYSTLMEYDQSFALISIAFAIVFTVGAVAIVWIVRKAWTIIPASVSLGMAFIFAARAAIPG